MTITPSPAKKKGRPIRYAQPPPVCWSITLPFGSGRVIFEVTRPLFYGLRVLGFVLLSDARVGKNTRASLGLNLVRELQLAELFHGPWHGAVFVGV